MMICTQLCFDQCNPTILKMDFHLPPNSKGIPQPKKPKKPPTQEKRMRKKEAKRRAKYLKRGRDAKKHKEPPTQEELKWKQDAKRRAKYLKRGRDAKRQQQTRVMREPPRRGITRTMASLIPRYGYSNDDESCRFPSTTYEIITCLHHSDEIMKYLPWWVSYNSEIILELQLMKQNSYVSPFGYVLDQEVNTHEIIAAAVSKNGMELKFIPGSKQLQCHVMDAVKQNGLALQFALPDYKDDRVLVMMAIEQNPGSFEYASENLRGDFYIIKSALKGDGLQLKHIPLVKQSLIMALLAVQQNGLALKFASCDYRDHLRTVRRAVQQNGLALQVASDKCKNDLITVVLAVQQNGLALQFASDELQTHPDILVSCRCNERMC